MNTQMMVHGIQAVVLGLSVGLILLIIRKHAPGSKLKMWVFFAGIAGAAYLIMKMFGVPGDSTFSKIALAATIMLSSNIVLQILNLLFWDYLLKKQVDVHIPRLVIDIINFIVLAIVAVAVLNGIFGVKLTAFLVTSTVLSAVIGLSLQDILGNLFAGLALQMERPYNLGEWVSVGDNEGVIVQMNWRTLTIRTRSGDHVTIPNATVSKDTVANHSRPDRKHMCRVKVGMAYNHNPETVKSLIINLLNKMDGVLDTPPPRVFLESFQDYSILYDVRFWITEYNRKPELENTVRTRIWYALGRAGMTIPFPIRDVTLREISADYEEVRREEKLQIIVKELSAIELFRHLTQEQIQKLARSSSRLVYAPGETLVKQGDTDVSLFMISRGEVEITVEDFGKISRIAKLHSGDYFGEMSLLTGEPRSASVTALEETEVIRVEKAGMSEILEKEESILEPLSAMLHKRLKELSGRSVDSSIKKDAGKRTDKKEHLLTRIRDFFGIG